ncbi:MAG: hypothetical protein GF372_06615 [Candidatus Marinimicrobia bacterium]|nr:hypothetical protein [Candidatus Neomarinimicrobiota bacterium]
MAFETEWYSDNTAFPCIGNVGSGPHSAQLHRQTSYRKNYSHEYQLQNA